MGTLHQPTCPMTTWSREMTMTPNWIKYCWLDPALTYQLTYRAIYMALYGTLSRWAYDIRVRVRGQHTCVSYKLNAQPPSH